jgi:uncharacterized iron-regulated membrane protein
MNWRRLHRATMTVAAPLMLYWVMSGLTIAVVDAFDPHQTWAIMGGGPGARLSDDAAHAASVPAPDSLAAGIQKSLAAAGGLDIAAVDYRMTGDVPRLQLSRAQGDRDSELRFYAATGTTMTPTVADGDPFRPRPAWVGQRERIKALHKGDAFGLPGQIAGLLTGIAIIVMTVSGFLVYLLLWKSRRRTGQSSLFWKSRESLWRRLHRFVAVIAVVFVMNKAVTGVILAGAEIQVQLARYHVLPFPYPLPTPLPPFSEGRLSGDLLQALQRGYDAALATAHAAPIVAIELVVRDGEAKSLVTLGGTEPRILAFDTLTGKPAQDWATADMQQGNGYFADWHQVLKRMHRGDIIGYFAGRYADVGVGALLLYLVISGIVLYLQMKNRRGSAGKSGLFWR